MTLPGSHYNVYLPGMDVLSLLESKWPEGDPPRDPPLVRSKGKK